MKNYIYAIVILLLYSIPVLAQEGHRMSDFEKDQLPAYNNWRQSQLPSTAFIVPPSSTVRTIGEWEELQAFLIAWKSYPTMLLEIVKAAKVQCKVILCYEAPDNVASITSYLLSGGVDTINVQFVNTPLNTVWSRDFGPWSAYTNDVDTLITIDWIYNRPRPDDDLVPVTVAGLLGTPLYQTTTAPWDLVHTGGNFMCDGFGTGFSSNLILTDNTTAGGFNVNHTVAEIDTIMSRFMGINRYIRMTTLPYDQIHHIDMHLKLLDEETILMGQYPAGIADGPQMEANLQYIIANYMSCYGTPYKVVRIPMPADNGFYPPNTTSSHGRYFTYTNSSFINNTLIVPTYNIPQDTTALRIYKEALPGYNIIGINSLSSIGSLGALHCISKELGTSDPLLISHKSLVNTTNSLNPYSVNARIQHRSGISSAYIYYRTDTTQPYFSASMTPVGATSINWTGNIPAQPSGSTVYYYISAVAVSGKHQVRPMPAPAGYWKFDVLTPTAIHEITSSDQINEIFPNPSKGITCIALSISSMETIHAFLTDVTGKIVETIYNGRLTIGEQKLFLNTNNLNSGVYLIQIKSEKGVLQKKLMVK